MGFSKVADYAQCLEFWREENLRIQGPRRHPHRKMNTQYVKNTEKGLHTYQL